MRDFIDLVEAAGRFPLPSAMLVFPDEEIRRTLAQGFDAGAAFGSTTVEYDMGSLQKLFSDAEDDESFKPGKHDPEQWLAKWLRGPRYRNITADIRAYATIENGMIRVAREIKVSRRTVAAICAGRAPGLGSFWSLRGGYAGWDHTAPKNAFTVFMGGLVKPSDIDWVTSMRRNANYTLGDEESEVFLPTGTPVTLIYIGNHAETFEITQPNQRA